MNHTKEPWRADLRLGCFAIYQDGEERNCLGGASDNAIVYQSGRGEESRPDGYRYLLEEQEDNARRICSCVNACAPFEDPETEIAKMRADRADAIKLVEICMDFMVGFELNTNLDEALKERYIRKLGELIKRMEAGE